MRLHILLIISVLIQNALNAQWQSELLKVDAQGTLTYLRDPDGFMLPDFSYAGYDYGESAMPTVPVVKEVWPVEGDNTSTIQSAINEVSILEPDENGFRGAVLLKPGRYEVWGKIYIYENGVVLRGSGEGEDTLSNTVLWARGDNPHQRTVIQLGNTTSYKWNDEQEGTRRLIMDDTVAVGSRFLTLENTDSLSVGDNIIIYHPCTEEWLASINYGDTGGDPGWVPGELPIKYYRYITAISNDTIELDAPVFYTLVKDLSPSYIFKHNDTKMRQKIGIENLRLEIESEGGQDEDHAWDGIRFNLLEDGWARNVTVKGFGQAGFVTQYSYRITIDKCSAIDPVGIITGERFYNFNFYHGSQLILVKHSYASNGRHHYISNGTTTVSGCVVYNCVSDGIYSATEPHRKWSQGILFDNLKEVNLRSSGRLVFALYNRGDKGTAHGWSAAQCVAWNCDFGEGRACIQKPPTSQNYAIGCSAKRITGDEVDFPREAGFIEGLNTPGIEPHSLYWAQLGQRVDLPPVGMRQNETGTHPYPLFPNPSNGGFTVRNQEGSHMAIYDVSGRMVYQQMLVSDEEFLVTGLHTGLYFLILNSGERKDTYKIIIQ